MRIRYSNSNLYLDPAKAHQVISNFKTHILNCAEKYGQGVLGGKGKGKQYKNPDGIAQKTIDVIDQAIYEYGEDIVGSTINLLSERWEKIFDDPALYYVARDQSGVDEKQDRTLKDFQNDLKEVCDEIYEWLEDNEEPKEPEKPKEPEEDTGGGFGGGKAQGGKYDDLPPEALRYVYNRLRGNLLALIRRRLGFGLDLTSLIPSIPKTITPASIRKIERLTSKIKSDYRYLGRDRGYRGKKGK